jgi:type IV pilus assembly protein PilE
MSCIFNERAGKACSRHGAQQMQSGFTMLELMMVLLIIGILAVISVGQYNAHSSSAQRREAIATLTMAQGLMERNRLQSGVYVNLSDAQWAQIRNRPAASGFSYTYSAQIFSQGAGYQLSAAPVVAATTVAQQAAACGVLSITHSNALSVSGTANLQDCWR